VGPWYSGWFGVLLGAIVLCAGAMHAEAVTWLPELRLEPRYDDNVLHVPEGSEDFVTSITPGITIFNRDPVTSYELIGRTGFTSYRRTDAKTSRQDVASLAFEHRPGKFERFDAHLRYVKSLDPIDFDHGAVTTRSDVANTSVRSNAEFYRVGAAVEYRRWEYDASELADGSAIDASARLYPLRNDATTGALEVKHHTLWIEDQKSLDASYQMVSLRRRHSEALATEYAAGLVQASYGGGVPDESRGAFAFGLEGSGYDPETPVTFRLRVADDIATTVEASIDLGRDGRSATLGWDIALDALGGLYKVPTLTRGGSIAARDTLYGGQVIDVGGSFGRTRPLHGEGPNVDIVRATAGVSASIIAWLSGRIGWDYMRQDAPVDGSAAKFNRNRYTLTLTAKPR